MSRQVKKKILHCQPCAFMNRNNVIATHGYVSKFTGEKTLCCEPCYQTAMEIFKQTKEIEIEFKGVTLGQE